MLKIVLHLPRILFDWVFCGWKPRFTAHNICHNQRNQVNKEGRTQLINSVVNSNEPNIDLVAFLLETGAVTYVKDCYGKTALDYAKEGNFEKIAELLTFYSIVNTLEMTC